MAAATYYSNNFRVGLKIIINGEPYVIDNSEFIKSGKGQSFTRVKLRCLLTGVRIEKIFKTTDYVEYADILDINLNYLYNDSMFWYFIDKNTFEQFTTDIKVIGDNAKWLYNQAECVVTLWNRKPIAVIPPNFVELKIIHTDPSTKSDTIRTSAKLATLSTGAIVKVPLFVQVGEIIRVDTRSGEYVSRVK